MVNKKKSIDDGDSETEGFVEHDTEVLEMAVLKVSDELQNRFSALIELQDEWIGHHAAHIATRRKSASLAGTAPDEPTSRYMDHFNPSTTEQDPLDGSARDEEPLPGPDATDRGKHLLANVLESEDAEKLRRRTEYAKEVRESGIGVVN